MARRSIIIKHQGVSYNIKIEDLLYVESTGFFRNPVRIRTV